MRKYIEKNITQKLVKSSKRVVVTVVFSIMITSTNNSIKLNLSCKVLSKRD